MSSELHPGEKPIEAARVPEVEALKERIEELESINEGHVEDKNTYRERIRELEAERDRYVQAIPITNEPYLGLATTEEMMRELICRFKMNMYGTHTKMLDFERALVLAEMLGSMGATEREYRPVDGS